MAVIETWFEQDLQKPVKVRYIDGNLFSHNGNGNRIGVIVTNNGEAVTLTGTVSGYAVLADGTTVPCTGTRSGNKASILVPAAAYSPGSILISIFLTDGTTVTTLAALSSSVIMARTGNQISPGSVVTDWTNTINAAMQSVETAAANLGNIVATPYANLTFPVPLGKYTIYNNGLYRCISPIASSEAWTAAHWTNVKLGDDVAELKSALHNVESASGIYTGEYEQGTINAGNGTNNNSYPNVRVRTTGYVKIEPEMQLLKTGTDGIKFTMCVYDENYVFIQAVANNGYIGTPGSPDFFDVSGAVSDIANAEYIRYGYETYPQRAISADEANNIAILVWKKADIRDAREIESLQSNVETELNDFATFLRRAVCDNLLPSLSGKYAVIPYLPAGTKITISRKDGLKLNTSEYKPYFVTYDENGNQNDNASTNVDATYKTITLPYDAFFIGWSGAPTTEYMVNIGNEVLPWQEYYPSPVVLSQQNKNELGLLSNSEKGYIHIGSAGTIDTTVNSNGTISVQFQQKLVLCFPDRYSQASLEWDSITENIVSSTVISGNSATITVGTYKVLVLSTVDYKLYIKSPNQVINSDFVILQNGSYMPQGWAVEMETYQKRMLSTTILDRTLTGRYSEIKDDYGSDCQNFSSSLLNLEECEAFIFVTDPHTFAHVMNERTIFNFFNYVEQYYKLTSADFILYGGDWLQNSDTPEEAAYKLGMIRGAIKNTYPSYLLVGNHDTNYQGIDGSSSRLSTRSVENIWYDGKKSYFRFVGRCTAFYCFDTGVEMQGLSDMNNLGTEQVKWFAESLLSEEMGHIAVAMHILFPTASEQLQPLSETVLAICQAYNNRSSYTFDGVTYDYTNSSGKVEFCIAGHTHVDGNYTYYGIPCVITRNAWIYGTSQPAIDLISVDYDTRKINLFRAGSGSDRIINL